MFKARPAAETREQDFGVTIEQLRASREALSKWTEGLRRRYGYPEVPSAARAPESSGKPESGRKPPRAA